MPFEEAVAWGNVCAAYTVSHEEALAIPDQGELEKMLSEYNGQLQEGAVLICKSGACCLLPGFRTVTQNDHQRSFHILR